MGLPADEQRERKLADVTRMLRRQPEGFVASPRPLAYLGWIIGLVTAAAVVTPFLSNRPTGVALAQALIYLVIGLAIGSLVPGAAASAMRSSRRRYEIE